VNRQGSRAIRSRGHPSPPRGLRVLTINAGSSSIKLRLLDEEDSVLASADLKMRRSAVEEAELRESIADFPAPDAIGHRIVHGGERFRDSIQIDDEVVQGLRELTDLAPLHQPKSLAALAAVSETLPAVPAVACFDTAFHSTLPEAARAYALPAEWRSRYGLRRYGFHGLSHAYAARRAGELLARTHLRGVTCHLGAGASLAAVRNGQSLDTTMGFTPLEGLVMATRSGSVDPGMLLWLLEREAVTIREMTEALEHDSGLQGLAGTADMREILERAEGGNEHALLARDVYIHRLRAGITAMVASLAGLDALVFTGGVGENSPEIRERALSGLAFLGFSIDSQRNSSTTSDRVIGADGSQIPALVVQSREDLQIAREVRRLLS
jgi:acetate kinase